MKLLLHLFLLFGITSYGQDETNKDWILTQKLPNWSISKIGDLKIIDNYKISDYMNPFYLQADFNNDSHIDIAITVIEKSSNKKGIVIIHFETDKYFIIGAGKKIGNGGDDFNWMDIWKVDMVNKKTGLNLEKSESASGLILWDGSKYIWTQTGD